VVLTEGISDGNRELLLRLVKGRENFSLRFFYMTPAIEANNCRNLFLAGHMTLPTYYKLFVGSVFESYDKILQLDGDIVVLEDVANLFATDLNGKTMGVIVDPCLASGADTFWTNYARKIGIGNIEKYFNAGVMVTNVKALREKNYEQQFIELVTKSDKFLCDQDALNIVMQRTGCEELLFLDPRWNYISNKRYDRITELTYAKYRKSAKIVHYADDERHKPWNSDCDLCKHWRTYAKMTPFYEKIMFARTCRDAKKNFWEVQDFTPTNKALKYFKCASNKILGRVCSIGKWRRNHRKKAEWRVNTPPVAYFEYLGYGLLGKIFPIAKRRREYRAKAAQCKKCFDSVGI
jgi:lipopolysaccharide biosynthesis glycosyltransferase